MATKKPQPSPAPLLIIPKPELVMHPLAGEPGGPAIPDLPTEDDAPAAEFAPADPDRKGGENNPLTDADALADLTGKPRPEVDLRTVTSVSVGPLAMTPELLEELRPGAIRALEPGLPVYPIPGDIVVVIKHLSDRAKTPTYGSAGAACFDLYAADTLAVAPGRSAVVPTDLAFEVPEGYVLMIYSRSGHGFKSGVRLANGTGIVDSDYRGHVPVCLHNDGRDVFYVRQGDRVAQAQITPVPRVEFVVVDELSSTERGENGFGSTGR